jgi:hypothetical protein
LGWPPGSVVGLQFDKEVKGRARGEDKVIRLVRLVDRDIWVDGADTDGELWDDMCHLGTVSMLDNSRDVHSEEDIRPSFELIGGEVSPGIKKIEYSVESVHVVPCACLSGNAA